MKTPDREKKPTCPKCGHKLETESAPCPRCTARPGGACPDCGRTLESGGPAAAHCPACHSVFGSVRLPPAKWGPREDAHLAAVEKWLADEWRDDTEIEAMLAPDGYANAARAFGQSPLAWEKGRAILKAELKARRERDKGRPVERAGDKVEPRHTEPPARISGTAPAEVWFDVDGEHRRLYAIRPNEAGKLCFFMDRAEVLELKGWLNPLPDTLTPADVQTVARMGGKTKGIYLILTHGGGSWGAYMLRRKYRDTERSLIPAESEEATKPAVEPATEKQECGCLTVCDNFRTILCHKKPYDLADATQAREMLRFLCAEKAFSQDTAQKKAEILQAVKAARVPVTANDWRPAHVFRKNLAALYRDAIGRNATKGLYWINP